MKILRLLTILFYLSLSSHDGFAQEKAKKTLFIIVDGVAAEMLESVNTPYIEMMSEEGADTRADLGGEKGGYSETPTISAVGYNSLFTGTWANKHNVWDNDIEAPN